MTDRRRTYEGRVLPKQDEEVVDQGLQFDLTTLSRRRALKVFGFGAGTAVLAACGSGGDSTGASTSNATDSSGSAATSSASLSEIPDETAGPYPGDGSNGPDILQESGVVRRDIRSSIGSARGTAQGVPMTLELTVLDMADSGAAFKNAAVYAWHCDRDGNYSMYSSGVENENYLRGVQIADADGKVTFTSIFPACYSGRWPHIHFEVYPDQDAITDSSKVIATSQVALPKNVCDAVYATSGYERSVTNLAQLSLDSDNVFGDDGGKSQIATTTGSPSVGYQVALTVPVDTRTAPSGGATGR